MWKPQKIDDVPDGIVLFDGVCLLCSRWVQFVLAHDTAKWFRFTSIQSPYGRALAERLGVNPDVPETNVVVVRGHAYFKSDTLVRVLERLPRWTWARTIRFVPRFFRNWIYDRIARNRYALFGKTETCMVPSADVTARFIDDDATARTQQASTSLFADALGEAFNILPRPLQHIHAGSETLCTRGAAEVSVTRGIIPALICKIANLPGHGADVPVEIFFRLDGNGCEYWRRDFKGRVYESSLARDNGSPKHLIEHFGPFDLRFRLTPNTDHLGWEVVGWRFLGMPLPAWTRPRVHCREGADGDRFTFDITFALPIIGRIVHYKGWILPAYTASRAP